MSVCFCQVQAQLEQTLEKLQGEQALNQQLSAEVEQVQQSQCPLLSVKKFFNCCSHYLLNSFFLGSGDPQKSASEPSRTDEIS